MMQLLGIISRHVRTPHLVIDLQFKGAPESVRKAVRSCCQEQPTNRDGQTVCAIGAFP